jgi:uncharacterized protein (TIGR02145 family)
MIHVTDIDGNVYDTVQIGSQYWLAENLKVTKFRNGVSIPQFVNGSYYNTAAGVSYYIPSVLGYGHYYNYFAMWNVQELAPKGCRIATWQDYYDLNNYLQGDLGMTQQQIAEALASERVAATHSHPRWDIPNPGLNTFGFSALPNGLIELAGLTGDPLTGNGIIVPYISYDNSLNWYRGEGSYLDRMDPDQTYWNDQYGILLHLSPLQSPTWYYPPDSFAIFMGLRCLLDTKLIMMQ